MPYRIFPKTISKDILIPCSLQYVLKFEWSGRSGGPWSSQSHPRVVSCRKFIAKLPQSHSQVIPKLTLIPSNPKDVVDIPKVL